MGSASIKGVDEMRRKLTNFGKKFPDEVGRALYQEAQVELTEVKKRTPVASGNLRASEIVVGPIRSGKRVIVYLVAGGPAAPYAVYVHEDPDAYHKVGQWKYLESVILESRSYMAARVAKRIDLNNALA